MNREAEIGVMEAAPTVPCHPNTLVRALKDGRLVGVKRLGKWWIKPSEVARFVEASARPSQPAAGDDEVRVGVKSR